MRHGLSGVRLQLILAAALAALLLVLATLQYRWIGEVSEAERDRMRASARRAAEAVAADFTREITRALDLFGMHPASRDTDASIGKRAAASERRWKTESKFPALIAAVFVAEGDAETVRLSRVDFSSGSLEALADARWPDGLETLRAEIASGGIAPPPRPGDREPPERPLRDEPLPPGFGPGLYGFGPRVVTRIPAIVIPDMRRGEPSERFFEEARRWLILRLDDRFIRSEFLPELVRRHFGEARDYDVAVLKPGEPADILFTTRPGFPASPMPAADAEVFFFGSLHPQGGFLLVGPGGPPPREFHEKGPGPRTGLSPPTRGEWKLVALHRSGSLAAAVEKSRRRNLAVSLAILLLLAAATATLLVSANRTRRLARQQIEFVAGITHELRTPLAAIRTAGQNLADGVVGDPDRVRQYGELVVREGRRLSELIEQALANAGIEARRGGLLGPPVALAPVIEEAISVCRPAADEMGTSVESVVEAGVPEVPADRSALRTMLENLIANAVKYGGADGLVRVSARRHDGTVEIAVSDRGPGIAAQDLPHIFEPFYRGECNGSGRIAGSGLGLSLVERIAGALGGKVEVESTPEKGTTFTVTLPAAAGGS
jgi:signal transduction histidine kinase